MPLKRDQRNYNVRYYAADREDELTRVKKRQPRRSSGFGTCGADLVTTAARVSLRM